MERDRVRCNPFQPGLSCNKRIHEFRFLSEFRNKFYIKCCKDIRRTETIKAASKKAFRKELAKFCNP